MVGTLNPKNYRVFWGTPILLYKVLAAGNPSLIATINLCKMHGWRIEPQKLQGVLGEHPFYKVLAAGNPSLIATINLYKMHGWHIEPQKLQGVLGEHPFYKVLAAGNPSLIATINLYKMHGWHIEPQKLQGVLGEHPFYKVLAAGKPCFLTSQNVSKMHGLYIGPILQNTSKYVAIWDDTHLTNHCGNRWASQKRKTGDISWKKQWLRSMILLLFFISILYFYDFVIFSYLNTTFFDVDMIWIWFRYDMDIGSSKVAVGCEALR